MSSLKETGRPFVPATPDARAKLFAHGGSQAVRLPKPFRFEGTEVSIRREGAAVILEPLPRRRQTPEERAAFWKAIDDLGASTIEAPERDRDPWRDPPDFG